MKRLWYLLVTCLLLGVWSPGVHALIQTRNVDSQTFKYRVVHGFVTSDVASSANAAIGVAGGQYEDTDPTGLGNVQLVIDRPAWIVGITISAGDDLTAGDITADVTINGTVTGLRAWLSGTTSGRTRFATASQSRFSEFVAVDLGGGIHSSNFQYGKVTKLLTGDRIGVNIETSTGVTPTTSDIVVGVIVLQ